MKRLCVAAVCFIGASVSGSAGVSARPGSVTLIVAPSHALVDERVDVRVRGLRPGRRIALVATTRDRLGVGWRSRLVLAADRRGVVDTRSNMKLFWSMRPAKKADAGATFALARGDMTVLIRALVGGHTVASGVLVRRLEAANLTAKDTSLASDGFVGTYYALPPGPPRPAVVQLGGSIGGHGEFPAAAIASHGYPSLSVGYFKEPGLPQELRRSPLEYFRGALQWLAAQPGVDPRRLVVLGISYGGQAALLSGVNFPELVHGVVTCTSGAYAGASIPPELGDAAWALGGKPVPPRSAISVERIAGPVLAFGAGEDAIGNSAAAVRAIVARARAHGRKDVVGHVYPDAGHGIGCIVPNLPLNPEFMIAPGTYVDLGGTAAANEAATAAAWPLVLRFLRTLPG